MENNKNRLPIIYNRSKGEILIACLLQISINSKDILQDIINSLLLGEDIHKADIAFSVYKQLFIFEYDGGYWHNKQLETDIKKQVNY